MIFRMTIIIGLMLQVSICHARNIAGVEVAETATLNDTTALKLNGAGIRSKFFFDIYIGALYLPTPTSSLDAIMNNDSANRVMMHFLYDELEKTKITDAWVDGFEENNSRDDFAKLQTRLKQFNQLFTDTKKGDVILLDYIPNKGTEVRLNGDLKGRITGSDFNKALLKVWLGEEPADSDLKQAMINGGS